MGHRTQRHPTPKRIALSRIVSYRGSKRLPEPPIAHGFLQHALRVELQTDHKFGFWIVEGLNQSILRVSHRREARRQAANSLMMITVHGRSEEHTSELQSPV